MRLGNPPPAAGLPIAWHFGAPAVFVLELLDELSGPARNAGQMTGHTARRRERVLELERSGTQEVLA